MATTTVYLHRDHEEYLEGSLAEFIAFLQSKLEEAPPELRDDVQFSIEYEGSGIDIYYERPKTEEDLAAENRAELKRLQDQKDRDLRELNRLKAMYPDSL